MGYTHGLPHTFDVGKYDAVVVGAGFAGATCARRLAETCGFKVCVIERRDHIAGNAYDSYTQDEILIHNYGPHIYHTNIERVHQFLSRFTDWLDYEHRVLALVDGKLMPVPCNKTTLLMGFGHEQGLYLYDKLVDIFGENKKVPLMELMQKGDPDLTLVSEFIFNKFFLYYTQKQWGKRPDEIDPAITGRVPIFIGEDDRYFPGALYQGMPKEGYTELFNTMLNHDLIDVFLEVDILDHIRLDETSVYIQGKRFTGEIIYTGPLDELFGQDLGALPYRTLDMQFETLDIDEYQPVGTVNYTTSEDFTRITEFKHLTAQVIPGKTCIMREYSHEYIPGSGQTPYYAVLEDDSRKLYAQYLDRVSGIINFHIVGRLAQYRYFDMDAVVDSALKLSDKIISQQ